MLVNIVLEYNEYNDNDAVGAEGGRDIPNNVPVRDNETSSNGKKTSILDSRTLA